MTYLFSVDREIGVKGAESMRATEELSLNIKYISNSSVILRGGGGAELS